MSSCRGIIIAGVTNRARTQMTEGFIRAFTGGRVFVRSGGVYHDGTVHPMAIRAMEHYGIDISAQSPASLSAAQQQRDTYDVYVSVDAPYTNRRADRYQRTLGVKHCEEVAGRGEGLDGPSLLAPATPTHWQTGLDATDAHQRWELWSPRDPAVYCERSTRKFQDELYEGEPLFMRLEATMMRVGMRVSQRWEVEEVSQPFAMERPVEQQARFRAACEALCGLSVRLLLHLEEHYGEAMIVTGEPLRYTCERHDEVRGLLERRRLVAPQTGGQV